jgi:hypothetical protein
MSVGDGSAVQGSVGPGVREAVCGWRVEGFRPVGANTRFHNLTLVSLRLTIAKTGKSVVEPQERQNVSAVCLNCLRLYCVHNSGAAVKEEDSTRVRGGFSSGILAESISAVVKLSVGEDRRCPQVCSSLNAAEPILFQDAALGNACEPER